MITSTTAYSGSGSYTISSGGTESGEYWSTTQSSTEKVNYDENYKHVNTLTSSSDKTEKTIDKTDSNGIQFTIIHNIENDTNSDSITIDVSYNISIENLFSVIGYSNSHHSAYGGEYTYSRKHTFSNSDTNTHTKRFDSNWL